MARYRELTVIAMARFLKCIAVTCAAWMLLSPPNRAARAWWSGGHTACTVAAVRMLPERMPEFFRDAAEELAEMSLEPDEWKSQLTPRLRASEQPEHFINLEHFEGLIPPRHRYEALRHYAVEKRIDPARGGMLPYALEEGCERLRLAFRQVRINPKSEAAWHRATCYAGWLAHYAQDATMPLHTTVHFDGKPGPGGAMVQNGIHARLDAFPQKNGFTPELLAEGQSAESLGDAWKNILALLADSHAQVERCYELDAAGGFDVHPEKARDFVLERSRLAAKFTADLWLTAWDKSDPSKATIK